jgi:hypothetical protein
MRFLVAILLLSASAFAQEGIPVNIGTGKFPPGLDGVTELDEIQKSRIDALKQCVATQRSRFERVLNDTSILNAAQMDLVMTQLDSTKVKQERLDFIQEALVATLETWQRIHELQLVGAIGGSADKEALARAAVFRFCVMWLKENAGENQPIALLGQPAFGKEGIPVNIGTGKFPPGLVGVLDEIQKSRIDALLQCVVVQRSRYEQGLNDSNLLLAAQMELAIAQLDTTTVKQERLEFIQDAFVAALKTWQRIHESQLVGTPSGRADKEALARAAVFRFRAMWLKENTGENPPKELLGQPAVSQDGIPIKIGTGKLPPGLVGVTELDEIQKSRIDALKQCVEVQRSRFEQRLNDSNLLLAAQMELAIAQLDTTTVKQERLKFIQDAFVTALETWQRAHELQLVGIPSKPDETQARAAVFAYRSMWLKERIEEVDQPTQGTYTQIANCLPNIDGIIVIDIKRINCSPEFAHIADGLTLPQFIKKIAFAMNPGSENQWLNAPINEIGEMFAANTSRIAIIKGPFLGNSCLVLECEVDRDALTNAIESGWNTDYAVDQREKIDLYKLGNDGSLAVIEKKLVVLGSAEMVNVLCENFENVDFEVRPNRSIEETRQRLSNKNVVAAFALAGDKGLFFTSEFSIWLPFVFFPGGASRFLVGAVELTKGELKGNHLIYYRDSDLSKNALKRIKDLIRDAHFSMEQLFNPIQDYHRLLEDFKRIAVEQDQLCVRVTGTTTPDAVKSALTSFLKTFTAKPEGKVEKLPVAEWTRKDGSTFQGRVKNYKAPEFVFLDENRKEFTIRFNHLSQESLDRARKDAKKNETIAP